MIDLEKLSKEHEALFPNATAESQFYKMEEEINEFDDALRKNDTEQKIKERADIIIVCGGLYRWFPKTAEIIYDYIGCPDDVTSEVIRKWEVNKSRKWEWNGKTYKHVGKDGNE